MTTLVGEHEPGYSVLNFLQQESALRSFPQDLWEGLEKEYGLRLYSELLYFLTQVRFEPDEAREHWENVLRHREEMNESLGRDVGLRVALADYFVNVTRRVDNPIIVEISLFLKAEERAVRDELTGLYNRRFFNRTLQQELERSRRFGQPVSLLMVDLDKFKEVNDEYGHPVGDAVLTEVAHCLKETGRAIDHVTRYGGEEFALILPRCDHAEALLAAERHRLAVAGRTFVQGRDINVTVSIGSATYPHDAADGLQLIECADQALYKAKTDGRNLVVNCRSDQRGAPRVPLEMSVVFQYLEKEGLVGAARTRNISLSGLLGATDVPVQEGALVEIQLSPGSKGPEVSVLGECVRVEQDPEDPETYYMGVRFSFENDLQKRAVHSLIKNTDTGRA